jgi:hypothetical protein
MVSEGRIREVILGERGTEGAGISPPRVDYLDLH